MIDATIVRANACAAGYKKDQQYEEAWGGAPVIPPRSNRKKPIEYDKHLYKERYRIECFFSKIKYFRRIFSRFDKSKNNFFSFLSLVGALIWLR